MIKSCAIAAIACALTAGPAIAAPSAAAAAETKARAAVAPLVVDAAFCVRNSPRRVVCLLRHPDAGTKQCRSIVLVRRGRARVIRENVCFEFRGVNP